MKNLPPVGTVMPIELVFPTYGFLLFSVAARQRCFPLILSTLIRHHLPVALDRQASVAWVEYGRVLFADFYKGAETSSVYVLSERGQPAKGTWQIRKDYFGDDTVENVRKRFLKNCVLHGKTVAFGREDIAKAIADAKKEGFI